MHQFCHWHALTGVSTKSHHRPECVSYLQAKTSSRHITLHSFCTSFIEMEFLCKSPKHCQWMPITWTNTCRQCGALFIVFISLVCPDHTIPYLDDVQNTRTIYAAWVTAMTRVNLGYERMDFLDIRLFCHDFLMPIFILSVFFLAFMCLTNVVVEFIGKLDIPKCVGHSFSKF